MLRLLKRTVTTAARLPFAIAWDVLSLGNMGEGASTTKVLREHEQQKQIDDAVEFMRAAAELSEAMQRARRPSTNTIKNKEDACP